MPTLRGSCANYTTINYKTISKLITSSIEFKTY